MLILSDGGSVIEEVCDVCLSKVDELYIVTAVNLLG